MIAQTLALVRNPDDRMWAIDTYIIKMALNLAVLLFTGSGCSVGLCVFLAVDYIHIIVSWLFNIYAFAPWVERLDIASINGKIVFNGVFAVIRYAPGAYILITTNLVIYLASLLMVFGKIGRANAPKISDNKTKYAAIYGAHFAISAALGWFYGGRRLFIVAGIGAYLAGGILWILMIPERWNITRIYTSLGWMHICVILGDAAWVAAVENARNFYLR